MMNRTAFRPKRMGGVSHKGLATNRVTPNGGVTNPTAILTTMMIPRWITSMLSSVASGISMGARDQQGGTGVHDHADQKQSYIDDEQDLDL